MIFSKSIGDGYRLDFYFDEEKNEYRFCMADAMYPSYGVASIPRKDFPEVVKVIEELLKAMTEEMIIGR